MTYQRVFRYRGTELAYEVRGNGIPFLILHGWGVDRRLMSGPLEPVFRGANRGFRRIYVDLPGMGLSKPGPEVKTSDDILEVLLALVDQECPGERFLVAGESYGGSLARGVLRARPQAVLGLFLLCPVADREPRLTPPRTVLETDPRFLSTLSAEDRSAFQFMAVVQTRAMWNRFRRDVYPALKAQNKAFLETVLTGRFAEPLGPLNFEGPVLVLTGRQDDCVGYLDQVDLVLDAPRATVAVLDAAGHNLQIEQEAPMQAFVGEWLGRVRRFGAGS